MLDDLSAAFAHMIVLQPFVSDVWQVGRRPYLILCADGGAHLPPAY
jgi:hypothetical protein